MGRVFVLLASICAQHVLAQDDLLEQLVQSMSRALIELPSNPHEFEHGLVANGLPEQDADRTVQGLVTGIVRCLLGDLRAYSEEHGESFADKLPHMLQFLDEHGPKPLLKEMIIVSQARGPEGESCALNELQKAGIGIDALD